MNAKKAKMKKVATKSTKKRKTQTTEKDPDVKKQSVFSLNLTRFELLHLRDLMGVLLPPTGAQTLSQALASAEDRSLIESLLWEKLSKLCVDAELPVDAEAPDYIIAPTAPPPLGVFQINQDLSSEGAQKVGFLPHEEEEEEEEE